MWECYKRIQNSDWVCGISLAISVNHVLACMLTCNSYSCVGFETINEPAKIRNLIRRWIRCALDKQKEKWHKCATAGGFLVYYLLHLANRIVHTYTLLRKSMCDHRFKSSMSKFSQNLFPEATIATRVHTHMFSSHDEYTNKQTNNCLLIRLMCALWLLCSALLVLLVHCLLICGHFNMIK